MSRPRIGITPDETTPEQPHAVPRYELKRAYADAVLEAGGLPLVLPYAADPALIGEYLALCDGLLVTGGAFDVPPELYGQVARTGLGALKPGRTTFELGILQSAVARDLPVLGICGGMQLLNVACGGTLYQDIGLEVPGALEHQQTGDRRLPAHAVEVVPGTVLAQAVGPGPLQVNTTHHQAVHALGGDLVIGAASADGVVEAIELPGKRFVVGVQWHPELLFQSEPRNAGLYRDFVQAANRR